MKRVRKNIIVQARHINTPLESEWFTWNRYAKAKEAYKGMCMFERTWKNYEFRIKPKEQKLSKPKSIPLFVLDAINTFWKEHHYGPSIRDLMVLTGSKSESHIFKSLELLRECGYIVYDDGVSRSARSVEMDAKIRALFEPTVKPVLVNRFDRVQERVSV